MRSEHFKNYVTDFQRYKQLSVEGRSHSSEGNSLLNEIEVSWRSMSEEEREMILTGPNIDPYLDYPLLDEE